MADNVAITAGSGTSIATDDVSSVHYQRVKVDLGGDGAASPLVRGAQAAANSIPVTLATDDAVLTPLGATTDAAPGSGDSDGSLNAHLRYIAKAMDQTSTVNPGNTPNTTPWLFQIRDAAGNARGANVDASNRLAVVADVGSALPAGSNAIGKLAANSGVDIGDVDVTSITGVTMSNAAIQTTGDEAHDDADAGNPVKIGAKAIAHGTNPTAVAAGDRTNLYANRHGIPFIMAGHPNIQTVEYLWTSAQTNDAIVTVASGLKIVVTQVQVVIDEATTVGVGFRIGFATATLPTAPTDGNAAAGYVAGHTGMVPGSIYTRGDGSGMLGVGADDEDLRITAEAPTSGEGRAYISYYTIES